jgi:hypothetical protein
MTWRRFLVPSQWWTWSMILKRVGGAEGGTIASVALRQRGPTLKRSL